MQRRHALQHLAALTASGMVALSAKAQDAWPSRPIRWVVPFSQGGGADRVGRIMAGPLGALLGQEIRVENLPGAASNRAAEYVIQAGSDGYTLLQAENALLTLNKHLFRKLPFDPHADFSYIGAICRFPMALVVATDFPAQDIAQFLTAARTQPGGLRYASAGNGTPHHLAMELFMERTGTRMMHVPYRGSILALQDVMRGQVPVMFVDLATGLPDMLARKVKTLALAAARRAPRLPDVPTLAQEGVREIEVFSFQGLLGPAGLAQESVGQLNRALNRALADADIIQRFSEFGMETLPGTPEEFLRLSRAESERWGAVVRKLGVSLG